MIAYQISVNGKKVATVWKYGELEFHFGPKSTDVLALLYSETEDGIVDVSIPMRSLHED